MVIAPVVADAGITTCSAVEVVPDVLATPDVPVKVTVLPAPAVKLVPGIVIVAPGQAAAGKLVTVGLGFIVYETGALAHPVVTVTLPVVAAAGRATVIWLALTYVAVTGLAPLNVTVLPLPDTKFVPLIVIVAPLAVQALVGEKLVIVGVEVIVNALPAPVVEEQAPVVTTTFPAPVAPAGSVTEIWVDEVNVTGEADAPLTVTVEPDAKPVPVIVIVVLLPEHALAVDKDETVGPWVVKVPNPFVAQTVSLETTAYVSYQY